MTTTPPTETPQSDPFVDRPFIAPPFVERRRRSRDAGMSLQINILSVFAVLLLITIGALISFAYYKNSNSILDFTERFIRRVAESCIDNSLYLFEPVLANVKASARLASDEEQRARDGGLFPFFVTTLENNPQLQSIYLAFDDNGLFLQAFTVPPNAETFGANGAKPPAGSEYALRVIDHKGGQYTDVWTYIKRDGTVLGTETSNQLNYDARPRPWYKDAVKKGGMILSDLLVYTSNRQPGVTAATPIIAKDGHLIGVAAANVSTKQLSDFLSHLDLGKNGMAVMVDEDEQLIAFPDVAKTVRVDGLKLSLVKADELNIPKVTAAFAAYRATPKEFVHFESNDQNYLAVFIGFPEVYGKKWQLVAIVLENDFVGTMKSNTRDIVAVGLILSLLSLVFIWILAKWITKPMSLLAEEIRKIQKFELVGPISLHSYISEINELIHSSNMMKRAIKTFGMFVPQDLVRELVGSGRPIELGGQDRTLTVMFTDIADFTSLSEKMLPSDLLVHMSRHLAAISQCVSEEHGTVDKYIGDAVMAFWGAPSRLEDHAYRGCTAALKAKHMQEQMNDEWTALGLPTLYVRIGLHSASVIVGNIGSVQRMSYTVVGDGVNVASRLEGVNKVYGTQICISQSVVDAAGPNVVVRPLDLVVVKGRKTGENIYELVALKNGPTELLPTSLQLEICQLTTQAFAAYQKQEWQQARRLYEQLAALAPSDKVPGIFIARCDQYMAEPPVNWDGVYTMKSK